MALVATWAAAMTALLAAGLAGGIEVGDLRVPPVLFGLALVPGLAAVIAGRRPDAPTISLPEALRKNGRLLAIAAGLILIAFPARLLQAGNALVALAALGLLVTSWWWPRPAFLRASVGLAVLMLFRPGASPTAGDGPVLLALMGLSAAVALVASTRSAAASLRPLTGTPVPVRSRRVALEVVAVALALAAGALVASQVDTPRPPSIGRGERAAGQAPQEEQPTPLDVADVLDPTQPGGGGRGDQDRVLLRVGSDRAGVLRAVTYDQWDGHQWRRSSSLEAPDQRLGGSLVYVLGDFDAPRAGVGTQRVRIEASYAAVAVGTPRVFLYEVPGSGQSDLDGTVRLLPPLGKGATYTVRSGPVDASASELRATAAGAGYPAFGPPAEEGGDEASLPGDPYVTAPPVLSDRAQALADELTAGALTDYDRVMALSDHLAATVTYDDKADGLPAGTDVVDDVLFGSRTATQQRLATTLALLARAAGLPARLATGFLPGERPFFGGDFTVRVRDAHTWVEVPFAGHGWQRFDPSGRIAAGEKADSLWNRLKRAWNRYWPVFVLAMAVVLALVVRKIVRWRRRLKALPWATRYFAKLTRLGRKRGRPRGPAETPAEYTRALAEGPLMDDRLVHVGEVVTAAAWSNTEPSLETKQWAERVLADVKKRQRVR